MASEGTITGSSFFDAVALGPDDPLLGTFARYLADENPNKVNLGVGAYRNEDGNPVVLNAIRKAEKQILDKTENNKIFKEYNHIDGLPGLKTPCQDLIFGKDNFYNSDGSTCNGVRDKIASIQTLSGTGALRMCAEFIGTQLPHVKEMYISDPTWGLEKACFEKVNIVTKMYPYWDPVHKKINCENLFNHMNSSPNNSLYVLQPCAHNPTGMDPEFREWEEILRIVVKKKHMVILDSAYQGYASGDLKQDRQVIEIFLKANIEFFVCQSFSKNMGLYGERIGLLHVVCENKNRRDAVLSQLKIIARAMYSNPPIHGALLVKTVLDDEELYSEWEAELKLMAERIKNLRTLLRTGLEKKGTPCTPDWSHITRQIGMFSFTGLTPRQSDVLIEKHHIYLMRSGRISVAGLNQKNIDYVINAFDDVVRNVVDE